MLPPEPLDIVVPVLGDDKRPLLILGPDHDTQTIRITLDCVVVRLTQELVVEDALGEDEPVPLLLPQSASRQISSRTSRNLLPDLITDSRWQSWTPRHLTLGVRVLGEEPDDLVGGDASSEGLPTALASYQGHGQVREAVEDLCEES